jgi:hypothetical protein
MLKVPVLLLDLVILMFSESRKNLRALKMLREPHLLQDLGCLPDQSSTVTLSSKEHEVLTQNANIEA